jgi:hypothetical protein
MKNKLFSLICVGFIIFISGCAVIDDKTDQQEKLRLVRMFPDKQSERSKSDAKIMASPLLDFSQVKPRIIIPFANGIIALQDIETGTIREKIQLSIPEGKQIELTATPAKIGNNLVVLFQSVEDGRRVGLHVAVVDLKNNKLNVTFPVIELNATKPTADGLATVTFDPVMVYPHSAVKYAPRQNSMLGLIYVALGNAGDVQPFHGWVFEIDMDAWKRLGAKQAISNVLVTTAESECPVTHDVGTREMICGGGVWSPAGPQLDIKNDGFELLVPTGNGQLDLERHDYANTLMRVKQGLQFDPECDEKSCANFDPNNPSLTCLESCKNLFIPRLGPKDKPLRPASSDCDDKTFWQCLAWMDYDLGANAPVKVKLKDGPTVWVQAGKEGGVYLIDAEHLGTQYDRMQIVDICGTKTDECKMSWRGMIVTHPVVTHVGEQPVVIIPTFVSDDSHAAGLIALKIVMENNKPKFQKFWQFPDPTSKLATKSFRTHPTMPVITKTGKTGEEYVWVVDIGKPGTLYSVRVKDGSLAAKTSLIGTGYPLSTPVFFNNSIYVTSNAPGGIKKAWLEGYRIELDK